VTEVSEQEIRLLKRKFGPIFAVNTPTERYICRSITRVEAAIVGYLDDDELTPEKLESIFRISVLLPEDAADDESLGLGDMTMVTNVVLEKSGLTDLESLQAQLISAKERRTIYDEIGDIICAAFPLVEPDQLGDITIDRLMELLVHAENVLVVRGLSSQGLMSEIDFASKDKAPEGGTVSIEDDDLARQLHEGAQKAAAQYLGE
jgi:hypothetical protein